MSSQQQTQTVTIGGESFDCAVVYKKEYLQCPMDKCKRAFPDEHALTQHVTTLHSITSREEKACPECGETFTARPNNGNKYCSDACYTASKGTVNHQCAYCGRFVSLASEYCNRCDTVLGDTE